jgi:hypothetical protein
MVISLSSSWTKKLNCVLELYVQQKNSSNKHALAAYAC